MGRGRIAISLLVGLSWASWGNLAASQPLTGSWYSTEACRWNPEPACPTASGDSLYQLEADHVPFVASWDYPLGTRLKLTSGTKTVEAIVLDRGPAKRLVKQGRVIDLSKQVYLALGGRLSSGIIPIQIERLK